MPSIHVGECVEQMIRSYFCLILLMMIASLTGCSGKTCLAPSHQSRVLKKSDLSIVGLRPGMSVDQAHRLLPGLLDEAAWQVAGSQEYSTWTIEGEMNERILRVSIQNQELSFIYGWELEVRGETLQHGDSVEELTELLGKPTEVLQLDVGPENTKTYMYRRLDLAVSLDTSEARVNGGFFLGQDTSDY